MKILQYEEHNGRVQVTVLYDDNTFTTLNMVNTNDKESILRDVYIISKDARNRQPFEGEIPKDLEVWNPPTSVATTMTVDFYNLTGKVYDQYGMQMEIEIQFSIEGTDKARIEDNKIIEDVVEPDTSYFIVAKVGDLEERQERFLYAPREVELSEIDILNKKIELLASENEAKDDLLQEIILQIYQ